MGPGSFLQGLLIKVLVAAIFIGGGAVAGVAWEHRPEQAGLLARFTGQSLAVQRDQARSLAGEWKIAAAGYKSAFDTCEQKRVAAAKAATKSVTSKSADADQRGSSAYDNGYFAGRIAGRASCKKATPTDAPTADPSPVPRLDGVRDLSKAFGARYNPAGR